MNNSHEKKARRIATLLAGYMRDTLTPAEHDELDEWVGASDKNMRLFEELTDEKRVKLALEILNDNNDTGLVTTLNDDQDFIYPKKSFFKRIPYAIKVAASVVLIAGIGTAWYLSRNSNNNFDQATTQQIANITDQPGNSDVIQGKFTLTTDNDDSVYVLDNMKDGIITEQGNSQVIKEKDQLKYTFIKGDNPNITLMNTIRTRDGSYRVTLSDGSKAWINAGSSIKFPAVFSVNERRVKITGEVYFEIAKEMLAPGIRKPFIVEMIEKKTSVEVTGTHFNVKAYREEPIVKTTLLEGEVKVRSNKQEAILHEREQAKIKPNGEIQKLINVATNDAILWKDGLILIEEEDLTSALNEICRWHDLELDIQNSTNIKLTSSYSGTLNLTNSIEDILKSLETTNATPHMSFELKGRKLTVTVTPS